MRRDLPGAVRVTCTARACALLSASHGLVQAMPLSGRSVTVVAPVVNGDLTCCSIEEEHARRLCFSANEPINNADIPSLVFSHRREGYDRRARDRPGRAICANGPFTEAPLPCGRHSL